MKNKKNKSIYKAFNSLDMMNDTTKQRILNEVLSGKKKKTVYNYGRVAIPALVAIIVCVNVGLISRNIHNSLSNIGDSSSYIQGNDGVETVLTLTTKAEEETTKTSMTNITTTSLVAENKESDTKKPSVTTAAVTSQRQQAVTTTQAPIPQTTQQPATSAVTETITQQTEPQYSSADGLPPLSDDLKQLFNNAYNLYIELSMGYSGTEGDMVTINGKPGYMKVNDTRFNSVKNLSAFLNNYFTDDMINTWGILDNFADGSDGLYADVGAKGATIGYSGHVFTITSQTDDRIEFKATIYIANNMDDIADKPFYTTPANPEKYYTYDRQFVMVKQNGNWRCQQMAPLF